VPGMRGADHLVAWSIAHGAQRNPDAQRATATGTAIPVAAAS
jgi:hypothetical protein